MGKNEKNLKKNVSVSEKKIGSNTDTEIGPWFRLHTMHTTYVSYARTK